MELVSCGTGYMRGTTAFTQYAQRFSLATRHDITEPPTAGIQAVLFRCAAALVAFLALGACGLFLHSDSCALEFDDSLCGLYRVMYLACTFSTRSFPPCIGFCLLFGVFCPGVTVFGLATVFLMVCFSFSSPESLSFCLCHDESCLLAPGYPSSQFNSWCNTVQNWECGRRKGQGVRCTSYTAQH